MSCPPYLITAILVCSFIFSAGCTEVAGTAAPAAPASSPLTLESLVLSPSEVPENFTLIESRQKNSTDVSRLARDLGWKEGYVVQLHQSRGWRTWSDLDSSDLNPVSLKKISPLSLNLSNDRIVQIIPMIYSNLSSPGLGSYSRHSQEK